MIPFARVSLGEADGLACIRCPRRDATARMRALHDIKAEVTEVVDEWTASTGPNVVFMGFEPFKHPDLPAIIAQAREAGAERIALETDGVALALERNARGALDAGVRHLTVTMLATGALGDALIGRPGHADAALAGIGTFIRIAGEAGVSVAVGARIAVCPHNVAALPVTVADLAAAGVGAVTLVGGDQAERVDPAIIAAACDTGTVNRVWVEVTGLSLPPSHRLHMVGAGAHA